MIIEVGSPDALSDVPPQVTVRDAQPEAGVELVASVQDAKGRTWRSQTAAQADAAGRADFGGDPFGLLWNLAPQGDDQTSAFAVHWTGFDVALRAGDATATLTRRFAAEGVTRETVDTDGLVATLFLPAGPGPHPAVAMYHGSGGGIAGFEPSGALLASHGYATLVIGWFGAGDTPPDIRRVPVESLARGMSHLRADPRIDPARVAVLGTSAGGEAAMVLIATLPQIAPAAAVSVAGSSVAWQALVDGRPPEESRFTQAGRDVPWAPVVGTKLLAQMLVENPLRRLVGRTPELHTLAAYSAGLASPEAERAALAVERCAAPLLLFAGADDEVWPAAPMARAMQARRGERDGDRLVVFDDTGHVSLRPPGLPTTVLRSGDLVFGGDPGAFAAAMRACWTELLAFLGAHV